MRPSHIASSGSRTVANDSRMPVQQDFMLAGSARRTARGEESWIEVSSQASSSSSMIEQSHANAAAERIPRPLVSHRSLTEPTRSVSATGSSQDEYDESSSESDRVLSSSNEDLAQEDEDEDNRTALGPRTNEVFTPQPNAFSYPPYTTSPGSYFPRVTSAPNSHIRSRPYLQRERERITTSSYQPDHDAALRASLTTLLSCAAAVRPKAAGPDKSPDQLPRQELTRPSTHPQVLRLVPESELVAPNTTARTTPSKPAPPVSKRRSRSTSKERSAKKHRPSSKMSGTEVYSYDDYFISPTVASWVISAGMVLVFSAISFSAGYAWGREVGRVETELGLSGSTCGREAATSTSSGGSAFRRLHWGSGSAVRA